MKHIRYVINLARFAFRENPLLYLSIVISLFSAAIELLAMSSLMPLFELVSGTAPSPRSLIARMLLVCNFAVTAEALLWAFIALFAIRIGTQLLGTSLSTLLGKRVMAQLCSGAFDQIIHRLSIREVNEKSIGFYISLAGDESFRASNLILSLTQFVSVAALAVLYFAAIASYSRTAAIFVTTFLLFAGVALARVMKISHRLGTRQTNESRRAGTLFLDALNNIKTVRAFSAERYVVGMHRTLMFAYAKVLFWVDEVALLMRLIPVLLLFMFFGIWLAIGGGQKLQSVGVAFIVTMIIYLMRFFPVVGQGVTLLTRIASDARSGRDVTSMLDPGKKQNESVCVINGRIAIVELRDVCFSYEGANGKMILNHLNLKLEQGRSYALVGRSGLGKTTLVDILLKFYEPTVGDLYLNGMRLADVSTSEIRKRIILVGQEPAVFDDTIRNNICLGLNAETSDILRACRLACIDDEIELMALGYDTRLQYRGTNLSGGQRQRIAIARALLRNPDVLILDEGTSALDKATQFRVIENILRANPYGIVILVTHDPLLMGSIDEVIDLETLNMVAAVAKDPTISKSRCQ